MADRKKELAKVVSQEMLAEGIYIAPSQFEALFVSGVHTDADIGKTTEAIAKALGQWNR